MHPQDHGRTARRMKSSRRGRDSRRLEAQHHIDDRLTFTARLSPDIVSHDCDGLVRRRMRFGRRIDADVRIYVQEVRAVHTAASDGGMRFAIRLPAMPHARAPCPPDRTKLSHHVSRRASGRCKVRARHRRIARRGKIARSRMQLLRRRSFKDGETCQSESVSARVTISRRETRRTSIEPTRFFASSVALVAARAGAYLQSPGSSAPISRNLSASAFLVAESSWGLRRRANWHTALTHSSSGTRAVFKTMW
jgi:hypothetical protein